MTNTHRNRSINPATVGSLAIAPLIYITESPAQETARWLYERGFNPTAQPYGYKTGYPWRQLQYTRLHPEHELYGYHALFAGRCNIAVMTGRTSGNLFVFDAESIEQFEYHLEQCHKRNIHPWIVRTSRGGHLWLRCKEGEVSSIAPGRMHNLEIRGEGGYVLAPPSVNRETGAIYEWLERAGDSPPIVGINQIDWLVDRDGLPVQLVASEKKPRKDTRRRSPLLQSTQDYLANGHTLPEGERHTALRNAACDYAANDYPKQAAYSDLAPIARASGLPDPNDPGEITRLIEWAYGAPRTSYRKGRAIPQWQYAEAYADQHDWRGRGVGSQKTVFYVLIDRARVDSNSNGTFRASIREVAEAARCSVNTAGKALDALKDSTPPLICYAGQDKVSKANLWRFSDHVVKGGRYAMRGLSVSPKGESVNPGGLHASHPLYSGKEGSKRETDTLKSNSTALGYGVSVSRSTDASERGALGHSGHHIYRVMLGIVDPATPSQIATASGATVGQVRHALNKLSTFSLAERVARGLWIAHPATDQQLVERVARPTNKMGKGEARAALFDAERQIQIGRRILKAIEARADQPKTAKNAPIAVIPLDTPATASAPVETASSVENDTVLQLARELGGVLVEKGRGA